MGIFLLDQKELATRVGLTEGKFTKFKKKQRSDIEGIINILADITGIEVKIWQEPSYQRTLNRRLASFFKTQGEAKAYVLSALFDRDVK